MPITANRSLSTYAMASGLPCLRCWTTVAWNLIQKCWNLNKVLFFIPFLLRPLLPADRMNGLWWARGSTMWMARHLASVPTYGSLDVAIVVSVVASKE